MRLPQPVIDITQDGSCATVIAPYHVRAWPLEVWIDAGFVFDGASIPELVRPYIGGPWDPRRLPAATVHDWLYASHAVSKWLSDLVFGYLLYRNGMGLWRSIVDWWAVSRFGHEAWHSHLPEEQALMIGQGFISFF